MTNAVRVDKLKPLVNSDFVVLVVPVSRVFPTKKLTIPKVIMMVSAPVCAEATTKGCGVAWWSMQSPSKVVTVLRDLASHIEKINEER